MALFKTCSGERTLQRYCCSIYGTAKQVAEYGGLNLGLEWNVLQFAGICDYIIKRMVLYRHSFREELSPIDGISEAFEAAGPPFTWPKSSKRAFRGHQNFLCKHCNL